MTRRRRKDSEHPQGTLRSEPALSNCSPRPLLGWREWVHLPELDMSFLEAKIDTGARSSSLDAIPLEEFRHQKRRWLRFSTFVGYDLSKTGQIVEARLLGYRDVRSSTGHVTHRPVIETSIQIGTSCWPIELTLTDRRSMGFRLLLGRSAVAERFHIDAARSFLASIQPDRDSLPSRFG